MRHRVHANMRRCVDGGREPLYCAITMLKSLEVDKASSRALVEAAAATRRVLQAERGRAPRGCRLWGPATWSRAVFDSPFRPPAALAASLPPRLRPFTLLLPLLFPLPLIDLIVTRPTPVLPHKSDQLPLHRLQEDLHLLVRLTQDLVFESGRYAGLDYVALNIERRWPMMDARCRAVREERNLFRAVLDVLLARDEQRRRWRAERWEEMGTE
jgi:hypothetical protein